MASRFFTALVSVCLLSVPSLAHAQAAQPTATTTASAPVFASPNDGQTPLRVAAAGSVLALLEVNGDWCHVEFQDPDLGRRSGYVQTKFVRISANGSPASGTSSLSSPRSTRQPVPQRGDFSIGYVFMRSESEGISYSLPLGIAASDAWRLHPNLDFVLESQYVRRTFHPGDVVGNIIFFKDVTFGGWSLLGGPRFWGGSRYGESVRAFGQVLGGVLVENVSVFGSTAGTDVGWGIQPGGGVEVPVSHTVAIRPQFDVLIGRTGGEMETDTRFNISVVFRLFKQ